MRIVILILILLATATRMQAQVLLAPLEFNEEQANHSIDGAHAGSRVAAVSINLPLFDDFTQTRVSPDPSQWLPGGTYVNNTYPLNQPNFNVATFDGLRGNGSPYNPNNIADVGISDSLTSRPIDLSVLKNGDSVYLRFSWQAGGIGDIPDYDRDSLRIQLKNRAGGWKTVWTKVNNINYSDTLFYHEVIRIGDSANYFYNNFQFSFQSFGRRSGNFDMWHVDYVLLDTGRLAKVNFSPDLTYRSTSPSILKNYTAMPARQYKANIAGETVDSIYFTVRNLRKLNYAYQTQDKVSFIADIVNKDTIQYITSPPTLISGYGTKVYKYKVDTAAINKTNFPKLIKYQSVVKSGLDPTDGVYYQFTSFTDTVKSDINFKLNDTITGYTDISNYYSYDDGSAEMGFGINQQLGKLVNKFTVNVPDSITHIQIHFPRIGTSKLNQPLILLILADVEPGTPNHTLLYYETILLKYSNTINGFITYKLSNPYYIANPNSTIYIGYQQSINDYIYTGYDQNIDHNDMVYYNLNNRWYQYKNDNGSEKGSLMIRPVFATDIPLGIHPSSSLQTLDATVYPNPGKGEINIDGKVKKATVYDLAGKLLRSEELDVFSNSNKLDLSNLQNGLYLLHLENGDARAVEKIFINK